MSYPIGTVAVCRASEAEEAPVWVKTVEGWLRVLPGESRADLIDWVEDKDFDLDWIFIEPENAGSAK